MPKLKLVPVALLSMLYFSVKASFDHAIYISVLEINESQMKVKAFIDNLDDATRNAESMQQYFEEKVELQINNETINFKIDEVNKEGDSYWITFKIATPETWNSFYLKADYLMELFPDQTNVVKIIGDKPQFFRLTKSNPTCSF